ncbi:ATP-dependent helicase [Paenibacillus daejeonensis]|uniref:ATP-dependent helicase n=1 Tax=Paenibacillus daejeonensis TaxID=135193 RepID=UPI000362E55A|nr:ATP-dependent helicase [Paenibacillus daejeonensis]
MKDEQAFLDVVRKEAGVELNAIQHQAVTTTEGPLLLLAVPGSGKTTTMIMRIGYLIQVKGASPERIKAVTFSRASAQDMKDRYGRLFPGMMPPAFSTIHSLTYEIVREHLRRLRQPFQLIEGEGKDGEGETSADGVPLQKRAMLRELYRRLTSNVLAEDQMEEVTAYISAVKNRMLSREHWSQVKTDVPQADELLQAYETFKESGYIKRLMDYDDMLTIGEQALAEDEALLRRYQERYDYILTDESQDTSLVQHAIMARLSAKHRNLCVVGDDDQSIYSWRGAEPSYLLRFRDIYPEAQILYMEQNYRSSQEIVETAARFIERNRQRYPKRMHTANPSAEPIRIHQLGDPYEQARYVVQQVQQAENLAETAVLYRNNASSILLMHELDLAGVPFYMKDRDNRFFSHWVTQDILNFMRMTFTDRRPELLERIHLRMSGYISKHQMAVLRQIDNGESVFDNLLTHVQLKDYQPKLLEEARDTFREMKGMPPLSAIRVIRGRLGYDKALETMCKRLGYRKDFLLAMLGTLEEIAGTQETMEAFAARLQHLQSALGASRARRGGQAVTLSTFHSAKGLEFERVYMVDLIEGVVPSSADRESEDLMEEAARLFYVGMTRAKRHLELLLYRRNEETKTEESGFVSRVRGIQNPQAEVPGGGVRVSGRSGKTEELPPIGPRTITDGSELSVGMELKHRLIGRGEVTSLEGDTVEITFSSGPRKLSVQICLEKRLLERLG